MKCQTCFKEIAKSSKFCPDCGAHLELSRAAAAADNVATEEIFPRAISKPTTNKVGVIVLVLALVMVGMIYAATRLNGAPGASLASTDWVPEGYQVVETDSDIAYKWENNGECSNLATQGCWTVKVVTNKVCSRILYVEANELDDNLNILGLTNATLGHIEPGQVAKLELISIRGGVKAQLSKIQCL